MSSLKLKNIALDLNKDSEDDKDEKKDSSDVLNLLPLEKLNLGQRKKLLVLCLGGLLVDRIRVLRGGGDATRITRPPDAFVGNFKSTYQLSLIILFFSLNTYSYESYHTVYKRPFCDEFLRFCVQRFEVALWSGALE